MYIVFGLPWASLLVYLNLNNEWHSFCICVSTDLGSDRKSMREICKELPLRSAAVLPRTCI